MNRIMSLAKRVSPLIWFLLGALAMATIDFVRMEVTPDEVVTYTTKTVTEYRPFTAYGPREERKAARERGLRGGGMRSPGTMDR